MALGEGFALVEEDTAERGCVSGMATEALATKWHRVNATVATREDATCDLLHFSRDSRAARLSRTLCQLCRPFVSSIIRSFVRSCVRAFVRSSARSCTRSPVRTSALRLVRTLVRSLSRSAGRLCGARARC